MQKKFFIGAVSAAMLANAVPAQAQDFYLGQIMTVGFTFCPRGTTEAAGQLLAISSNSALFSLYGTTYGGNGTTTFQLPDLRGRRGIGQGQGTGLPAYVEGQTGGTTTQTTIEANLANHTHDGRIRASTGAPTSNSPVDAHFPTFAAGTNQYTNANDNVAMADDDVQIARVGGGQPFDILDPFLTSRYCVVIDGIFPSRN